MSQTDEDRSLTPIPDLPKRLVDLEPAVVVGTAMWTAALAVFLVLEFAFGIDTGFWLGTSIAAIALGFLGLGIIGLQRRASRRGDRGSTPNL